MMSYEHNRPVWLRHAISAVLTFFTGFAIALIPELETLDLESLKTGAWVGVLFAAVRAGLKTLLEAFISWKTKRMI